MTYREYPPGEAARDLVECFWTYSSSGESDLERIAPDGRCELVVHLGKPYSEASATRETVQARALFAGQLTRPLLLRGRGPTWSVAARFRPAAAGVFLHQPASAATDRRVPLEAIDPDGAGPLHDHMHQAASDVVRLEILANYVADRGKRAPFRPVPSVAAAAEALEATDMPSIAAVASATGLSLRSLQRLFKAHVGVPPQEYASIIRFRRIFDELASAPLTLSQAAQAAGYCDHPQMARDFQRFVGCSASQFMKERDQLSAALTRGRNSKSSPSR